MPLLDISDYPSDFERFKAGVNYGFVGFGDDRWSIVSDSQTKNYTNYQDSNITRYSFDQFVKNPPAKVRGWVLTTDFWGQPQYKSPNGSDTASVESMYKKAYGMNGMDDNASDDKAALEALLKEQQGKQLSQADQSALSVMALSTGYTLTPTGLAPSRPGAPTPPTPGSPSALVQEWMAALTPAVATVAGAFQKNRKAPQRVVFEQKQDYTTYALIGGGILVAALLAITVGKSSRRRD